MSNTGERQRTGAGRILMRVPSSVRGQALFDASQPGKENSRPSPLAASRKNCRHLFEPRLFREHSDNPSCPAGNRVGVTCTADRATVTIPKLSPVTAKAVPSALPAKTCRKGRGMRLPPDPS